MYLISIKIVLSVKTCFLCKKNQQSNLHNFLCVVVALPWNQRWLWSLNCYSSLPVKHAELERAARSLGICPSMPDCCTQERLVCIYPYNHRTFRNLNKNTIIRLARCSVSAIFHPLSVTFVIWSLTMHLSVAIPGVDPRETAPAVTCREWCIFYKNNCPVW